MIVLQSLSEDASFGIHKDGKSHSGYSHRNMVYIGHSQILISEIQYLQFLKITGVITGDLLLIIILLLHLLYYHPCKSILRIGRNNLLSDE